MEAATLKGSIEKWKRVAAGTHEDQGINDCPLCKLFFMKGCQGCPVSEKTGQTVCRDSPYPVWGLAVMARVKQTATNKKLKKLARAELNFLRSLLPKKRRTK